MINEELKKYIEENIFPVYDLNEKGHGIEHIKYVIDRSLKFAKEVSDINYDMVYVIAAYHDIGHHIDAKNHEKVSAEIMEKDVFLKQYFTEDEIFIIKQAIEEHRSSLMLEPTTVYGKIIVTADRNIKVEEPFMRTYSYRVKHFPTSSLDEIIEDSRQHLISKYGKKDGYAHRDYFNDEEYEKYIEELNEILFDSKVFTKKFKEINCIKGE